MINEATQLQIEASVNDDIASQLGSASNETVSAIAWEAYVLACDAFDVACTIEGFAEIFPVYAELV